MTTIGFRECKSQPCVFFHTSRDVQLLAHVDDFLICGSKPDLVFVQKQLEQMFEIKGNMVGPDCDESASVTFLNRHITWTRGGGSHTKLIQDTCNISSRSGSLKDVEMCHLLELRSGLAMVNSSWMR